MIIPFSQIQIDYKKIIGQTDSATPEFVYFYPLGPGETGRITIDYVLQDSLGNKKAGMESREVRRPLTGNCVVDGAKPMISPTNNQVLQSATYTVEGTPEGLIVWAVGIAGKVISWAFIFDPNTAPAPM